MGSAIARKPYREPVGRCGRNAGRGTALWLATAPNDPCRQEDGVDDVATRTIPGPGRSGRGCREARIALREGDRAAGHGSAAVRTWGGVRSAAPFDPDGCDGPGGFGCLGARGGCRDGQIGRGRGPLHATSASGGRDLATPDELRRPLGGRTAAASTRGGWDGGGGCVVWRAEWRRARGIAAARPKAWRSGPRSCEGLAED